MQMDALREVGNIGAGNVASSLSVLLHTRIDISVSKVELLPLQDIAAFLGGAEKTVSAIYLELQGEIHGSVMLLFSKENAAAIIAMLNKDQKAPAQQLDEYEESILKEFGNISAGTYIDVLSKFTNSHISCSVPYFAIDMLGAVLNQVLVPIANDADQAVLIETNFIVGKQLASGFFLLMPDMEGLTTILNKLGILNA